MKRSWTFSGLALVLFLCLVSYGLVPSLAEGAIPQLINFQGILRDGSGNAVADSSYSVIFTIYDGSSGIPLWAETTSVSTSSGLFSVLLGSLNPVPDSAFNNPASELGIKVGADPEMTPWQKLTSVGYTFRTEQWTSAAQNLFRLNGNVGIGTTSPAAKLHVSGVSEGLRIQGPAVGNPNVAYASFYDAAGTALGHVGDGSSGNMDMYLTSYDGSVHLYTAAGDMLTATGSGNVGIGTSTPSKKLTVAGSMEIGTGAGDYQHLRIGGGNSSGFLYGSYPHFGDGIHMGYNYYADGAGTNQIIRPDGGTSRISMSYGSVALATGPPFGGEPVDRLVVSSDGKVGIGTYAPASALHVLHGAGAHAILGISTATSGIYFGVYGRSDSPDGYGVFCSGGFAATGTKDFRIDHPQDPTGRYLLHYSAESPDVLNMYTGNVVTDANGYATITLPEYFEEINKDPRYSLTVINEGGTEFVQAMVVEEIRNNRFAIRTSKPSVKVSWRVDALRNDRWVRTYGAPVEVEKQGLERGKYQHPELYSKPKEMGINYRPDVDHLSPEISRESAGEVRK